VCVSIALFENDEPVVGVVFNPIMGEMYHAVKSHGAFFNDVRLPFHAVPFPETLAECLVSCEYGSDMSEGVVGIKFETVKNVVKAPVRGVRSLGSAALELCHVAKGVFDVFWEGGIHIWDVGAGAIIVTESGGVFTNFGRSSALDKVDWRCRKFLAVRAGGGARGLEMIKPLLLDFELERDT